MSAVYGGDGDVETGRYYPVWVFSVLETHLKFLAIHWITSHMETVIVMYYNTLIGGCTLSQTCRIQRRTANMILGKFAF